MLCNLESNIYLYFLLSIVYLTLLLQDSLYSQAISSVFNFTQLQGILFTVYALKAKVSRKPNFGHFLSFRWGGVFVDSVSGIAGYEWGVGSLPGHADTLPFTPTREEQGVSTDTVPNLQLQEGKHYYVTVRVSHTTHD